jgi:ubiquinone/menaquinone biosynthesis C-methylase UbiE
MRRDWDERARRNAFHYIASWRDDWDDVSFFESGEQDYLRFVHPVLQKLRFEPAAKSMAELGCGAGRMTHSFASRFRTVCAVDISAEMQARAKCYLQSLSNIQWIVSDGGALSELKNSSLDFVFSYLVLQHMPNKDAVRAAIQEMMRILSPGGAFLFQFNGSVRPTMNWKGRTISGILDGLATIGLHGTSRRLASAAGIDPEMVGKTWRGATLSATEIEQAVRPGNASSVEFSEAETPLAWCYGRKSPEAAA